MPTFKNSPSDIILYSSSKGTKRAKVIFSGETFWHTQKRKSELFTVDKPVITKHLQNDFITQELNEDSVSTKFAHTAEDSKLYPTNIQ